MGHDLELDFEKYCVVDQSPKTVLLSPRHSNIKNKKVRKKPKCRNEISLTQTNDFTEISFHRYRSASCRTAPSSRLEVDEAPRRGSVYQSSNEVGKMNRTRQKETEGRKKIEFSRTSVPFSLEIVDSLCSSDDDNTSLVNKENHSTRNKHTRPASIPLHKSLSARLAVPHSPNKTEPDSSKPISPNPKTRFSPFRKMFDPFTKPKSQKSPLGEPEPEPNEATPSLAQRASTRNVSLRKSLLNDFSNTDSFKDSCSSIGSSSSSSSFSSSSPAHLLGFLKTRNKNGVPCYEFSVKNPNETLVAKTWNTGDGFNRVYTFHSGQTRRKSNVTGRGSKDCNSKDFLMTGQMQVSCYLCTELINAGSFDNSMLTEFVLYDLARPKETSESTEVNGQEKVNARSDFLASSPWSVSDLHPDLESGAIVIQFPSEKRESLTRAKVNVVIPSGNHGLPNGETCGPSTLLDRWRLGGGCDCGGWDMGCPLVVFGGRDIKKDEACKPHTEIFVKGTNDNTPALTMKMSEEGQHKVEFHAQLSSLQAFSICVAILHTTEASMDKNRQVAQCDSLRVFIEDEVKHLIEAVAEEEKRKPSKNLDEIPSTFVVNPPFSPMSRA